MDRQEKTKYILKQMLLLLRRSDFIRCQIVGKKLSPKLLEAPDMQPLKIKFYELMTLYYLHEDALLDVAKCFGHTFNTQSIQDDPEQMKQVLLLCRGLPFQTSAEQSFCRRRRSFAFAAAHSSCIGGRLCFCVSVLELLCDFLGVSTARRGGKSVDCKNSERR